MGARADKRSKAYYQKTRIDPVARHAYDVARFNEAVQNGVTVGDTGVPVGVAAAMGAAGWQVPTGYGVPGVDPNVPDTAATRAAWQQRQATGAGSIGPAPAISAFGGAGGVGGAAGGAGGAPAGAGYTNTTDLQPDLSYSIAKLKERAEGDLGAGRAIDVALGKLRELGIGEDRVTNAALATRGLEGTVGSPTNPGAQGLALARNSADRERRAAGLATDIALGREAQRDDIYRSIGGMGGEQGRLGVANQGLALQQQAAQDANVLAQQRAAQAQQNALLSMLTGFASGGLFG